MSGVTSCMHVPSFDGKAPSFANYKEKVALWNRVSTTDLQQRGSHLPMNMTDIARKVCMTVGKGVVGSVDGVADILRILRKRFAPDAIDCI